MPCYILVIPLWGSQRTARVPTRRWWVSWHALAGSVGMPRSEVPDRWKGNSLLHGQLGIWVHCAFIFLAALDNFAGCYWDAGNRFCVNSRRLDKHPGPDFRSLYTILFFITPSSFFMFFLYFVVEVSNRMIKWSCVTLDDIEIVSQASQELVYACISMRLL